MVDILKKLPLLLPASADLCDVDAMSLADINQLTVEAERVAEMHEELRDYRRAEKSAPSETSSTPVEATDTDA